MNKQPKSSQLKMIWWRSRRLLHAAYQKVFWKLVCFGEPDSELTIQIWRGYGAKIGKNVNLNPTCFLDRGYASLLEIKDHCVVAMGTSFILHDSSVNNVANGLLKLGRIIVEEGAYIGAFVIVLPGVVIGKGAIVGAGSLVKSDVPAGTVFVGCPASLIASVDEVARRQTERSSSPSNMVTYIPFLSQKDRVGISKEELKAFVQHSDRQVADWIRNVRRHNV